MTRARIIRGAAAALGVAAALAPNAAAASGPKISQLVVFDNGSAKQANVKAAQATVKVGHNRCAGIYSCRRERPAASERLIR